MFEFIETPLFTRIAGRYLDDDEYAALRRHLDEAPESGVVVPGSGGVRKPRWSMKGRGKSGGLRLIYYLRLRKNQIWMLTIYGKNVRENIPGHVLKRMKEGIENAEDD
jgi:hypothetical protein